MVPVTQAAAPPSCSTLTGAEVPQAKKKKKSYIYWHGVASVVSHSATPWTMDCQASLSGGFSRQEHWSVLANIGYHTLLEHCIYCCPSFQLSWVLGAARNPVTQAAVPPPLLALTGADPRPPGQPQEQTQVDDPCTKVEINHNWNPGAVWLRKKTQNLPTSCTSCRLNPHDQLGRLCAYGRYKRTLRAPTKENALFPIAVYTGGKNSQE